MMEDGFGCFYHTLKVTEVVSDSISIVALKVITELFCKSASTTNGTAIRQLPFTMILLDFSQRRPHTLLDMSYTVTFLNLVFRSIRVSFSNTFERLAVSISNKGEVAELVFE